MQPLFYIAGKDLLLQWRDRMGFFWWMLGFPLLVAILIGEIFSGILDRPTQAMQVALVDEANSPESRQFAEILTASGSVAATPMSADRARDAVRRGYTLGLVILKPNFAITPSVFTHKRMPLAMAIDPRHKAEAAYLQAALNQAAIEQLRRQWFDPAQRSRFIDAVLAEAGQKSEISAVQRTTIEATLAVLGKFFDAPQPAGKQSPLDALSNIEVVPVDANRIRPHTAFEICFPMGIMWGLIALAAEFAQAIVKERQAGTLLRLRVAPIARWQILAGSGLACFTAAVAVVVMLLLVGHIAFGVRLSNAGGLTLAVLAIAICFVGITMMLSVSGKTEAAVGGASWAFLLIMSMVGGGMVPQIFMPHWMEIAGSISPVKWSIRALEGGIWRDFTVGEMSLPCGVLAAIGLVCGVIGIAVHQKRA